MKTSRKSLDNKALKMWREAIWSEFNDRCAYCGKEARNAHHIVGKRNHRLRHDKMNGINLCSEHHTFSSTFSAHQTPTLFSDWLEKNYPEKDAYTKEHAKEMWDKDYERIFKDLGE